MSWFSPNRILTSLTRTAASAVAQKPRESASPARGRTAPDFRLQGTGGEVALGDLIAKGPVILAFFPKAFTLG